MQTPFALFIGKRYTSIRSRNLLIGFHFPALDNWSEPGRCGADHCSVCDEWL